MTILNAHVTADRVLMCMDTATVSPDRATRADQSKIFYLPHANIAFGSRGVQHLALGLFNGAWAGFIGSLDQLEDAWTPQALDDWRTHMAQQAKDQGISLGDATGAEILAAGFSQRRGRMTALHYVSPSTGNSRRRKRIRA